MDKLISVLEEVNKVLAHYTNDNTLEIVSIAISGLALLFAILVPVRIANKQNKIALFEKRFAAYSDLLKLKAYSDLLKSDECSLLSKDVEATGKNPIDEMNRRRKQILVNFHAFFCGDVKSSEDKSVAQFTLFTIRTLEISIHTLPMLYSKKMSNKGRVAGNEITIMFEDLSKFLEAMIPSQHASVNDKYRTNFITEFDAFFDKYADIFENGIRI